MERLLILQNECTLMRYTREVQCHCEAFTCGDADLDEFFENDVFLYEEAMIGKSYCWVTNTRPHYIVCLFTVSNDCIKSSGLPKNSRNRFNRLFDNEKRNMTYPATLIGRLGANQRFQGMHVGWQLMNFIKDQNIAADNANACRFLVVDALNKPDTLAFYERNGFLYMHKSEEIERIALKRYDEEGKLIFYVSDDVPQHTRMMYFDLKQL